MKKSIKASLLTCIALFSITMSFAVSANQADPKVGETAADAQHVQAEAYILYTLALRDAKKSATTADPTINVTKQNNMTTYTFKEHVLKECGSHLNGTIQLTDATANQVVKVSFPGINKNSLGITHFSFDITQDKNNIKNSQGSGVVNDQQFDVKDLMQIPGFAEAAGKVS